ncbi:MAG: hypothetical protein NT080_06180 [Spirochaetes bacterium]|nr:hypothetical protein [Spirochaetota bacterium]
MKSLVWSERILRTYHISTNNLMALFDMADFVFDADGASLPISETPLGKKLLSSGFVDVALLEGIRKARLCYSQHSGGKRLEYLPNAGKGRDVFQIGDLLKGCAKYSSSIP